MIDFNRLTQLTDALPMGHSDFQIAHFVVAQNGYTRYGALKQVLREMQVRVASIQGKVAELEDIKEQRSALWRRLIPLKKSAKMRLEARDRSIRHSLDITLREFIIFYSHCMALSEGIDLSPETIAEHEYEFWHKKYALLIATERLSPLGIRPHTFQMVATLPDPMRTYLLELCDQSSDVHKRVINESLQLPIPERKMLTQESFDKLLNYAELTTRVSGPVEVDGRLSLSGNNLEDSTA